MFSLIGRLGRADCYLLIVIAGCANLVAAEQKWTNPPAFSYLLHCSGCHIEDGSGDPPEVPDLRQNLDKLLRSETGRGYMLRVPGVTDTPVTPREMAELMNWLIAEFYPELQDFRPFSAEEVVSGRATRLANPLEVRQTLLGAAKDLVPTPASSPRN